MFVPFHILFPQLTKGIHQREASTSDSLAKYLTSEWNIARTVRCIARVNTRQINQSISKSGQAEEPLPSSGAGSQAENQSWKEASGEGECVYIYFSAVKNNTLTQLIQLQV